MLSFKEKAIILTASLGLSFGAMGYGILTTTGVW